MNKELIKNKLDEYLEFNSDELFQRTDFCVIFGGAIRDIVSGGKVEDINDIDVMGLPHSLKVMGNTLERNGYNLVNLVKPDIYNIYKDIKCIFEPKTYINKNNKIVQLIKPTIKFNRIEDYKYEFIINRDTFYNLLSNVDLTSSGLFYDGNELYESLYNSYLHCKLKVFDRVYMSTMYQTTRTMLRSNTLQNKGWKQTEQIDKKVLQRVLKILKLRNFKIKNIEDYKLSKENRKPYKN